MCVAGKYGVCLCVDVSWYECCSLWVLAWDLVSCNPGGSVIHVMRAKYQTLLGRLSPTCRRGLGEACYAHQQPWEHLCHLVSWSVILLMGS